MTPARPMSEMRCAIEGAAEATGDSVFCGDKTSGRGVSVDAGGKSTVSEIGVLEDERRAEAADPVMYANPTDASDFGFEGIIEPLLGVSIADFGVQTGT